ncbi:MAG: glycerate kinase type-2 family protein [Methyloligellaceae bacterium]
MTGQSARDHLRKLLEAAVRAASPRLCVPPALPDMPAAGQLIVLGAGKGAAAMVQAAERHYLGNGAVDRLSGLAVTRYGFALETQAIELLEAGHPVPDHMSVEAASRALDLAWSASQDDLIVVLLSGGASALWSAPAEGLSLEEKQSVTRSLLASGAPISEFNCVHKHLSRIKGGRLARAAAPARLVTLAISDVPGDDPSAIGSGPTVGDPTTLEDAMEILQDRGVPISPTIATALSRPANETPFPEDPLFASTEYRLVARPADGLVAAAEVAGTLGYEPRVLGDALEGEARDVAHDHAALALACKSRGERTVLLSAGEVTVTVSGDGRGGPNQEYALALAIALAGESGISALAADTDGTDGGSGDADDPAGAIIDDGTLTRAGTQGLDPDNFLENNDSTGFFDALDDLVITGPTRTNVNDFRAILIDP